MIAYSVTLFAVSILIFVIGLSIHRGNTGLIHDYHRTRVRESERLAYGRAFAKGLFVLGAGLLLSGVIALFGSDGPLLIASQTALFAGIAVSLVILIKVQKRYNGGMF